MVPTPNLNVDLTAGRCPLRTPTVAQWQGTLDAGEASVPAVPIERRQPGIRFQPPFDHFAAAVHVYEVAIIFEYPGKFGWYGDCLLIYEDSRGLQPNPHPIGTGLRSCSVNIARASQRVCDYPAVSSTTSRSLGFLHTK